LKRFLQRHLETALSRKLLAGDVTEQSRVTIDFKGGELQFHTEPLKTTKEN
jgi:ATP-dependent Clp protease ATP-binding subunit ClpB